MKFLVAGTYSIKKFSLVVWLHQSSIKDLGGMSVVTDLEFNTTLVLLAHKYCRLRLVIA